MSLSPYGNRRSERRLDDDELPPHWPGPMTAWSVQQRAVFDRAMERIEAIQPWMSRPEKFILAYREVVRLRAPRIPSLLP